MYKRIKLPNKITPVVEEVWIIVHNPNFITAIEKLRKKHRIIPAPNSYLDHWVKENTNLKNFEPLLSLNRDIHKLILKARISESMHYIEIVDTLRAYIFTEEIKVFENGLSAIALPNVEIKKERGRVRFTLFLYYDTGKREISKIVRGSWKEIRAAQKELAGDLLRPSPLGIQFITKVWDKKYVDNETEEKIAEDLNGDLSKYEIRKLIKRINKRIKDSFE